MFVNLSLHSRQSSRCVLILKLQAVLGIDGSHDLIHIGFQHHSSHNHLIKHGVDLINVVNQIILSQVIKALLENFDKNYESITKHKPDPESSPEDPARSRNRLLRG